MQNGQKEAWGGLRQLWHSYVCCLLVPAVCEVKVAHWVLAVVDPAHTCFCRAMLWPPATCTPCGLLACLFFRANCSLALGFTAPVF